MSSQADPSRPRSLESVANWDLEADVVIVGYGGAGACSAIEATRAGAEVLILEAAGGGGGCTAMSGGHLYLGGGTRPQKAVGLEDTAEDMYRYLMAGDDGPDQAKSRVYADESVAHFEWLVELGVPFTDAIWEERHTLQPDDACLIWSGNEKAYPFNQVARPAARGHKVAREGEAGAELWVHLSAAVEASGARIECDTPARALVVDSDGRVVGVIASQQGRELAVCARRGVVLSSGGFIMNRDMLRNHIPSIHQRLEHVEQHGNPHDQGVGIRMGAGAGAAAIRMGEYFITVPWYPPASLTYGILVNARGQRFVNEDCYHGRVAGAAFEQPEGKVYLIADDSCFGWPEMGFELAATEGSVEELERALELPATTLQHTLSVYNQHAARGEDPLFHKHPNWLKPLDQAPFAALDCSLGRAPYIAFTLGGLRTLPSGETLTEQGSAIPGLFAAGANASGITRSAGTYCSGQSVGDATFFGRRAGRSAAASAPWR
ncbi:MAG: FAD-dependent oxidoreductase [Proteobacteria bacterium]|nr:FAD-dependent oxidoreductase [Pseudomonadota bacterium]